MCGDKYEPTPPPGYITIRDYFESLLRMTNKIIESTNASADKAIDMARTDMERRMKDFPEQFLKKGEVGELLSRLTLKVEALEKVNNQMEGKASVKALEIVRWVSITGLTLSAIGIVLRFFKV